MAYHAICPECKNDISLDKEELSEGDHFECGTCGITLDAQGIKQNEITQPEIVEMEK